MSVEISHLDKAYGKNRIFSDFSAEISDGSITWLAGPSGSGKTTLLRLITGLESADAGSITGMPEQYGVCFQEDRLCMEMTAAQNVDMVLPRPRLSAAWETDQKKGRPGRKGIRTAHKELIASHLARVGLPDASEIPVREYSGGMRRRVAIVRAVMARGGMMLLDEPFTGLDEESKRMVLTYLKEEQRGRTILLISHDGMGLVDFADHKIILQPT